MVFCLPSNARAMQESDEVCLSILNEIEECLTQIKRMPFPPYPIYENTNKAAAYINFRLKKYESATYFLSEAHGGGIRSKLSLIANSNVSNKNKLDECLSLNSEYVAKGYKGLIERLKEMPSEWTLVQITRNYNPKEIVTPRPADTPMDISELFITRYQCGEKYKNNKPLTIKVNKPRVSQGQKSLFDILKQSLENTNDRQIKDHTAIRKLRDSASQSIKNGIRSLVQPGHKLQNHLSNLSIAQEIHISWIEHWICMLLGNYVDEKLSTEAYSVIDTIIQEKDLLISDRDKIILYQIINAAVQLTETEINNILSQIDCSTEKRNILSTAINAYRMNGSHLMLQKRHPVLLILDEHLECLPWESISCLKRHPISRVSSIHMVHMLYTKYKDSIENGLMKIKNQGYYILNPDKTLVNAEKRMLSFFKARNMDWEGIQSVEPTSEQFSSILQKNDILLYCGHGNGSQYLHSMDLDKLNLHCIPMLFGCSSVKHTDKGGRSNFVGASYGYLKAGCPSVIGMLWNVTSLDADNMARAIFNIWLPGTPIDLQKKWPKEFLDQMDYHAEPELLRTLAIARKTTRSFFNCAALVARGIPVIMKE